MRVVSLQVVVKAEGCGLISRYRMVLSSIARLKTGFMVK